MDDIHPLVLKVAAKLVPVAIGGMAADVKLLSNQLRDSEECGGWQYIMTSFLDQAVGHPTYRFEERTICFCVPDKFRVKVPNIFICDQGAYGSTIGLAAAGWLLRVLGIVPLRDRQSEDDVWLVLLTASAVLPAQLLSCLPESPCLAACFTGRQGLFNEFCEQLAAYVQEMDYVYWLTGTLGCQGLGTVCQLWCSGPGKGKMRRGGTMWRKRRMTRSCWSEVVTARRGAPPARRSRPPTTAGTRLMIPPKGQPKRPRTVPPSICFTPK